MRSTFRFMDRRRSPPILLVDAERVRRGLVAAAFRSAGCAVIEAGTALEAIDELARARHLWAIVIADTRPAAEGDELRRFVRELYPGIPMIGLSR